MTDAADRLSVPPAEAVLMPMRRLDYLPIGLFGSVMSLVGLSVAWRLAQARWGAPPAVADAIAVCAVLASVAVSIGYAIKWVSAPDVVAKEFAHPIAGNLFGLFFISVLLLPIVIAPVAPSVARALWIVGAIGMTAFAWRIVARWLGSRHDIAHATPAWIVPVVGLLDVPLAIPALDLPPLHGLTIAALGIGLFFAIPLFTLIFTRLVFEPPMPDPLAPTLLILVAPFAVGMSTYVVAEGRVDDVARALFAIALFVTATLLPKLRHAATCCPFRVAWWAIGFPLVSTAIAGLRVAASDPGPVADTIAVALLAFATLAIVALAGRTLLGIARGELRALSK